MKKHKENKMDELNVFGNGEGIYYKSGKENLASMCIKSKGVCESATYNCDLDRKFEDVV